MINYFPPSIKTRDILNQNEYHPLTTVRGFSNKAFFYHSKRVGKNQLKNMPPVSKSNPRKVDYKLSHSCIYQFKHIIIFCIEAETVRNLYSAPHQVQKYHSIKY